MKNFTLQLRLLALSAFAFLAFSQPVRACVDYHTTVFVTCHYDTTNWTDIAITVSNLRLFGGNPNDFCSCAITNYTNLFTTIQYVAFVDSGTTNPVPGFAPWSGSTNASNAWESVLATGDWSGFVSGVNGNGLTATNPVELIIRASLPPGYNFSLLDSNLTVTQFGTDEWSDTNQNLTASHQSITGFWTGGAPTYVAETSTSTYFTDLDDAILLGLKDLVKISVMEIGPVPATDHLYVKLPNPALQLESAQIFNAAGQMMGDIPLRAFASGKARLDLSSYPDGIYFLHVRTDEGVQTKKFVVM
jgi:hypothetical protein